MQPDTLNDEVFGELGYDPPLEEWYGRVELAHGQIIEVRIWWADGKDGPFAPVLDCARVALRRFREREAEHRRLLTATMLERYQGWTYEEDAPPDAKTLAAALTATQLSIRTDGAATAHYDDATELFGDHLISAELNSDGWFSGFSLQG